MQMHHISWLSAHKDRTEGWLKDRLAEGFDVHHLDGDHSNNNPANLILIEAGDHMRLHGMKISVAHRLRGRGKPGKRGMQKATALKAQLLYERSRQGEALKRDDFNLACRFAEETGAPAPQRPKPHLVPTAPEIAPPLPKPAPIATIQRSRSQYYGANEEKGPYFSPEDPESVARYLTGALRVPRKRRR